MGFWTTASLELENNENFHRVLEFVKPYELDTEPQTDVEYEQVMGVVDTLQ